MIERYLREFDRWTAGSPAGRREHRAELESHLREAEAEGRLDEALARMGSPRDAARAFTAHASLKPAPLRRRLLAAAIDYGTLVAAVMVAPLAAMVRGVEVTLLPRLSIASPAYERATTVLGVLALVWFGIGLSLLEWRTGRTPGKAVAGIRAVSLDGTGLSLPQALLRRLPLWLSGPLQWLDWVHVLWSPRRQRAFDVVAGTIVVDDPAQPLRRRRD